MEYPANRRFFSVPYDTVILALYGACWLTAFFLWEPSIQTGLATLGRLAATAAATLVLLTWITRPEIRLGWLWRDLGLLLVVGTAAAAAFHAKIRFLAHLELLQTLQLPAIFIVAAYLCSRRPQPLFLLTLVLMGAATATMWRWGGEPVEMVHHWCPPLHPFTLSGIGGVIVLAILPWFAPRWFRAWHRGYHWVVLAAALVVAALDTTGWTVKRDAALSRLTEHLPPPQNRRVIESALKESWALGCGPENYEWMVRSQQNEGFRGELWLVGPGLLLLVERGALGWFALVAWIVAMLGPFRTGAWSADHPDVVGMARPLRWAVLCVFLLWLFSPFMSAFTEIILWSLLGMMRGWSSRAPVAAIALVAEKERGRLVSAAWGRAAASEWSRSATFQSLESSQVNNLRHSRRWSQSFLTFGTLLLGIGLLVLHSSPWIGARYRRLPRPGEMLLSDVAWLERLELSEWWWPGHPGTYYRMAMHYRAKADAGHKLLNAEIEAVTRAYEAMIRANPYDAVYHQTLMQWHAERGDFDKAIEAARRALSYFPASSSFHYLLGAYYRRLGRLPDARDVFEQARLLNPQSLPVLKNLEEIELQLGNKAQAQHWQRQALQIAPGDRAVLQVQEKMREDAKEEPAKNEPRGKREDGRDLEK